MGERETIRRRSSKTEAPEHEEVLAPEQGSVAEKLLDIQTRAGNQSAVAFVQTELKVGPADDRFEREADAVAGAVVDGGAVPAPAPKAGAVNMQRAAQRDDPAGPAGGEVDGATTAELHAASASGTDLPAQVRARLEPTMGDLSGVRVHTDARAADLNDQLGARAFTHGNDIFFGRGEYQPSTSKGLRTIAHEATHVVQQRGGPPDSVQRLKNPFRKLGKKINTKLGITNVVGSGDVKTHTQGGGGTANPVDKVEMKKHSMGEQKKGFFKAHGEQTQSQNAVGSSRLARGLGMEDVIARNKFGKIGGKTGAVSGMAKGEQLRENEFNEPVPRNGKSDEWMQEMVNNGMQWVQKEDGEWYKQSATVYSDVDLSRPETQKGLNDLQWFDAISGQADRHSGNVFIDPETGAVMGIDDDVSFDEGVRVEDLEEGFDKFKGLPNMIDENTATKIMALKPEDLPKILVRTGDPKKLSKAAIDGAKARLKKVQDHIEKLGIDGQIYQWNATTYKETMTEDKIGEGSFQHARTYTRGFSEEVESARKGEDRRRIKGIPPTPTTPPSLPKVVPPPVPDQSLKPKRPLGRPLPKPPTGEGPPPVPPRALKPQKPKDRDEAIDVLANMGWEIKEDVDL